MSTFLTLAVGLRVGNAFHSGACGEEFNHSSPLNTPLPEWRGAGGEVSQKPPMLHRRHFLAAAAALPLVGCRRDPNAPVVSSGDAKRIADEQAARKALLMALAASKVSPTATRTTPPREVDLLKEFPELKPLVRMTHRLHPRFSDEPRADQSKLGGAIAWPASEPWPTCEVFKIPYVPVLQLLTDDCPSQVKFKPGTDVLQLLWSPRDHKDTGRPKPLIVWRALKDTPQPYADLPATTHAFPGYIPVPCRFFTEKLLEFPDWSTAKVTPFRGRLEAWKPGGDRDPVKVYTEKLSVAPGTKVGGFPWWIGGANPPACDTCHRGMDYLLTLDTDEWREPSWIPVEEVNRPDLLASAKNAAGLTLAGNYHVFVCRRCPDWPVKAA